MRVHPDGLVILTRHAVDQAIAEGSNCPKIAAIKALRMLADTGLKEAKDLVEAEYADREQPCRLLAKAREVANGGIW